MKAIAINGSPRKNGNTEILLRAVLKPLSDAGGNTEVIQLGGKLLILARNSLVHRVLFPSSPQPSAAVSS